MSLNINDKKIQYELVKLPNKNLPVKISLRKKNANTFGCELHWHEQLEFYYVVNGGVSLLCNGQQEWLYKDDIGFVNWCEPHRGSEFLDSTEHYIIQIDLSILDEEIYNKYGKLLINSSRKFSTHIKNDQYLSNHFKNLITQLAQRTFGHEIMIKSLIYAIIAHIIRLSENIISKDKQSRMDITSLLHVRDILKYIASNYTKHISLEVLSHEFGMSRSHMCRIFKQHTNLTLLSYVNELKCSHAASLILNGMALSEVYQHVGFSDYNYFSRLFKKVYGMSPAKYRKEHKGICENSNLSFQNH